MHSADLLLAASLMLGAALYSSVGHGGASAYLALMSLFGVPPTVMRPTALALNLLVAGIGSARYVAAGQFRWRTLWPFLIGALPSAVLGGALRLPDQVYKPLVGAVLLISAARMLWRRPLEAAERARDVPIGMGILAGAGIGLLAGLTGTGGGIFLSPLLLVFGWSTPRQASGIAALFIVCNSAAGLLGNLSIIQSLPPQLPVYAGAVAVGGVFGTFLGARLNSATLVRILSVVLAIAGVKLILGA